MKHHEFSREPLPTRYFVKETLVHPLISTEPHLSMHILALNDKFLIIATRGFWQYLSSEDVVHMVIKKGQKVNIYR